MSSSFSFAHHNSVYQFFFFILFPLLSCFPLSTYFPTNIPSFFVSFLSSPFFLFFFLLFLFLPSRFLFLLTILPSSSLSALPPPPPPRPHLTSSSPPSFLPNLLLQSLPLQLPAYPSAFILPWTLNFFCFSPSHHPLLSFQTTSTRL